MMPYKDKEKQALAKRRSYERNLQQARASRSSQRRKVKDFLLVYKKSRGCSDCGRKDYLPCCYEFDHLSDKVEEVNKLRGNSVVAVMIEVVKCDVVCRNCHKARTNCQPLTANGSSRKLEGTILMKRQVLDEIKSKPCTDCKELFPIWSMEMDHLSDKDYSIKRMLWSNCSLANFKKELDKCEPVCGNCHAIRTYNRPRLVKLADTADSKPVA